MHDDVLYATRKSNAYTYIEVEVHTAIYGSLNHTAH